jgi:preprotein translocase subunit SecB
MTDNQDNSNQGGPDASPNPPLGFPIMINAQYVKDFSFENPNAPAIFQAGLGEPHLDVGINVQSRSLGLGQNGDQSFEVWLAMRAESKIGGKQAFIAELSYAGVFTVPKLPDEQLKMFLLIECPRLLFPFARQIIADAVHQGGFPPLLLNPIDFAALYMQNRAQMSGETGTA